MTEYFIKQFIDKIVRL